MKLTIEINHHGGHQPGWMLDLWHEFAKLASDHVIAPDIKFSTPEDTTVISGTWEQIKSELEN